MGMEMVLTFDNGQVMGRFEQAAQGLFVGDGELRIKRELGHAASLGRRAHSPSETPSA